MKNPLKAIGGFVKLGVAYPERSAHVKSANMHNLSTMPVLNKNSETSFLQSLRAPQKNYRVVEGFWKYRKKSIAPPKHPLSGFLLFSWSNLSGHFHKGGPDRDKGNQRDHRFPPHFALILYLSSWLDVVLKCLWKTWFLSMILIFCCFRIVFHIYWKAIELSRPF